MAFTGTYVDGVTARTRVAVVSLDGGNLAIEVAGEAPIRWPLEDIRDADPPESAGKALRLRRVGGAARLTLSDPVQAKAIRSWCPNLRKRDRGERAIWRLVVLWSGAAAVVIAALFWIVLPWAAGAIANAIPADVVHRFGERVVKNIAKVVGEVSDGKSPICADSDRSFYLTAITNRVLPPRAWHALPIHVWVVRAPIVNAVALPGGQIVVFSGLLDLAQSGDELAGVLAHEIGHVMLRHPTRIAIEKGAVSAFFGLFFGDISGGTAVAGVATTLLGSSYSREMEREADAIGVLLMRRNRLDPRAMAHFLERVSAVHGKEERMMAFLSTHPTSAERAAAIEPAEGATVSIPKEQFDWLRRVCDVKP